MHVCFTVCSQVNSALANCNDAIFSVKERAKDYIQIFIFWFITLSFIEIHDKQKENLPISATHPPTVTTSFHLYRRVQFPRSYQILRDITAQWCFNAAS